MIFKTTHFVRMNDDEYRGYRDYLKRKHAYVVRGVGLSYARANDFAELYNKYSQNLDKTAKKMGITRKSAVVYRSAARKYGMV